MHSSATSSKATKREQISVDVELWKPSEKGMSTIDTPLPPIFYVIAGAGPAAVINHSTLVHSEFGRKRLEESPAGRLPILHIGFKNPWARYMQHGMGQLPYLLSLPGFKGENQVKANAATKDGGLDSRVFAGGIDKQFEHLRGLEAKRWEGVPTERLKKLKWPWMQAWVALVQTRAKEALTADLKDEAGGTDVMSPINAIINNDYPNYPDVKLAPYRLLTVRREESEWIAEFIYCQFIDFCTGTGRPRVNIKPADTPEHKKALTPPWLDPATWTALIGERRILSGMDAICDEVVWAGNERICVPKGGGIALNAAEKAVHNGCYLDWFDDKGPLTVTFANPRNYTFLKHWTKNEARGVGENEPGHKALADEDMIPHYEKGRLGKFAMVSTAKLVDSDSKVEVTLTTTGKDLIRASNRGSASLLDGCWQSIMGQPGPSKKYDRLALPHGLEAKEVGQPHWIARHLEIKKEILNADDGRMLGLGTADQSIRLLGAAAQVFPLFTVTDYKPQTDTVSPMAKMWDYRATLPVSTVPDGFILSAVNIAAANKFFTVATPNRNINTLRLSDVETYLNVANVSEFAKLADLIVAERNVSNGYKDVDDLIEKLTKRNLEKDADVLSKGEEAYVKKRVIAVGERLDEAIKEECKLLDQTAIGHLPESEVGRQVEMAKGNLIKLAPEKKADELKQAALKAKSEFRVMSERSKLDVEFVTSRKDGIVKAFAFVYDPVDD